MDRKNRSMTNKSSDKSYGFFDSLTSNLMKEGSANDDPLQEWRLKYDNESAARHALYAARMQLNGI